MSEAQEYDSWSRWIAHRWDTTIHSGLPLFWWVHPKWTASQIPSQKGKVVIVTGGNSGTGYETAKSLYEHGATVYIACRNPAKGQEAIEDIHKGGCFRLGGMKYPAKYTTPKEAGTLQLLQLDLSDLASIDQCAEDFKRKEKKLDLLFANAGVMVSPEGMHTKQGYTLQFGTNCLGHQRLISLFLPILLETSRSNPSSLPRVISTSSAGHSMAPTRKESTGFDPRTVVRDQDSTSTEETPVKGRYENDKWTEYGQSKWGNIAVARYLHWLCGPDQGRTKAAVSDKAEGEGEIISIAVHPGLILTNLGRHMSIQDIILAWVPWVSKLLTKTADVGASNQLWAATIPDGAARKLSGEYIVPFQHVGIARPDLDNPERVASVWQWCEEQGRRHQ